MSDTHIELGSVLFAMLRRQAFELGLVGEKEPPSRTYDVIAALAFHDGVSIAKLDTSGIQLQGANLLFKYAITSAFNQGGMEAFSIELFNEMLNADGCDYRLTRYEKYDVLDSTNPFADPKSWCVVPVFVKCSDVYTGTETTYPGANINLPFVQR